MAFKIKVIVEAEAAENNSQIAREYGLSESMVRRWRRDQATILSGELKMSAKRAKMGRFTPKYPELDLQVMEWFSEQRDQGKCLIDDQTYVVVKTISKYETVYVLGTRACHSTLSVTCTMAYAHI